MSKENAQKLITEVMKNEELRAKVEGITDPAELAKKAVELGYDVTPAELEEAEQELRKERAAKTDAELSADELESAAGGWWGAEEAPDGHDLFCVFKYYNYKDQIDNKTWCNKDYITEERAKGLLYYKCNQPQESVADAYSGHSF